MHLPHVCARASGWGGCMMQCARCAVASRCTRTGCWRAACTSARPHGAPAQSLRGRGLLGRRAGAAASAGRQAALGASLGAGGAVPGGVRRRGRPAAVCSPLAEQVIWATPEALTAPHPLHGRSRYMGRVPAHNNSLAVPYLGRVHRLSMQSRAAALAAHAVVADKQLLAAVADRPRVSDALPQTQTQADMSQSVTRACRERSQDCTDAGHADLLAAVAAQRRAWFCVAPPSGTPTSVALADCFAAGLAVPAVFDEYLYDLLPLADVLPYRGMAAYVPPGDAVAPGVSYLDHLAAYGLSECESMLCATQNVSQALQYVVRPQPLLMTSGCSNL